MDIKLNGISIKMEAKDGYYYAAVKDCPAIQNYAKTAKEAIKKVLIDYVEFKEKINKVREIASQPLPARPYKRYNTKIWHTYKKEKSPMEKKDIAHWYD